jgi:hypothetical protein
MLNNEKKFIWSGQSLATRLIKQSSSNILSKIDEKLYADTYIVGIALDNFKINIPLDEIFDKKIELLGYVTNTAKKNFDDNINSLTVSNSGYQISSIDKRFELKRIMIINAFDNIVKQCSNGSDHVFFYSPPILINEHVIFAVMKFSQKIMNSYYTVGKNPIYNDHSIPRSFVESVIKIFLQRCSDTFQVSNKREKENVFQHESDEILRNAGRMLMYIPTLASKGKIGFKQLFNICNSISTLKYEGSECAGQILIAKKSHLDINVSILFEKPISLTEYRAIRKLLEISTEKLALLSDSACVYGFGNIKNSYNENSEDIFTVAFKRQNSWTFSHDKNVMMQIIKGIPNLAKDKVKEYDLKGDIREIFKDISDEKINKLCSVIQEIIKEKKGTMLVVTDGALQEAQRLEKQGIRIEPLELNSHTINNITKIDGAVLVDTSSNCYAIGVILDGLASAKGTSSRGARYNSAIRYVESTNYQCFAVVVSEDGIIDIIKK